jgi:heme A synthase
MQSTQPQAWRSLPCRPAHDEPHDEPTVRNRQFSLFAWGVFGYSLLAILWGYFLRISESGDGCGTDWPLCHGAVVPATPHFSTFVEFTHRLSSGLVLLLVLAMAVWAFRAFPRGAAVRKAAGASLLFTVSESLFGAVLVVFGWVATDVSTGRILIRPVHVTNTFLLMAALVLTAWWASRGTSRVPSLRSDRVRLLLPGMLGTLALAWTGAWTGLATTAFPAQTLQEGVGQYLDPEHLLVSLRMLHPLLAVAVVAILIRMVLPAPSHFGRCAFPPRQRSHGPPCGGGSETLNHRRIAGGRPTPGGAPHHPPGKSPGRPPRPSPPGGPPLGDAGGPGRRSDGRGGWNPSVDDEGCPGSSARTNPARI